MNYYLVKKLIPPILNRQYQTGWTVKQKSKIHACFILYLKF